MRRGSGSRSSIGIFFVFASAAYWIFERNRGIALVVSLLPKEKRRVVRDTWDLIDLKLGAYVRGQLILIVAVATVLSLCVLGDRPALLAPHRGICGCRGDHPRHRAATWPGRSRSESGSTESWQLGLAAGLIVLVGASAGGLPRDPEGSRRRSRALAAPRARLGDRDRAPFGGFAVLLAIPLAAVAATLVSVIVLEKDPAEEEVPTVLFPAKDAESC